MKKRRDELTMRVQGARETLDAVHNQMSHTNQEISGMTSQLTLSQGELEQIKVQRTMAQSRISQVQSANQTTEITRQCDLLSLGLEKTKTETQNNNQQVEEEKKKKDEIISKIKELNQILGKPISNGLPQDPNSAFGNFGMGQTAFGSTPQGSAGVTGVGMGSPALNWAQPGQSAQSQAASDPFGATNDFGGAFASPTQPVQSKTGSDPFGASSDFGTAFGSPTQPVSQSAATFGAWNSQPTMKRIGS